jgi:Peptidase A4 family
MRRRRLLVLLAVAAVSAAAAGAARGANTDVSSNWSGYVVGSGDPYGQQTTFSTVSGSWVQPKARCSSTAAAGPSSSAFWVGLGGNSNSNSLEQAGTETDCTASGAARYSAWYELVPRGSVNVDLKVAPGDTISASISVHGTRVIVQMRNVTTGTSFAKTLSMASPDVTSAEWIAEAPSMCASSYDCRQTALTDFGTVKFSHASATGNGHTGTISDPAWTATAIQLETYGGGRGFGRYASQLTAAEALPSSLTGSGTAFSVTWKSGASSAQQDPYGNGYGNGYGYGGGYGRGYYGY